ncbi:SID1 transmembrane member [Balamuthia mandrillaris]
MRASSSITQRSSSLGCFFLFFLLLLLLQHDPNLSVAAQEVQVESGQVINGTVGDGISYSLNAQDGLLLDVVLEVADPTTFVQAHITDQNFRYIFDVAAPPVVEAAPPNITVSEVSLCSHAGSPIALYRFQFFGTPSASYTFYPQLLDVSLQEGEKRIGYASALNTSFFYFDVTRTDAPLQVTVSSDSDEAATLEAQFEGCPEQLYSPLDLDEKPDKGDAYLTFSTQARLTVAKFRPELKKGRWFFGVTKQSSSSSPTTAKSFSIQVEYGLDYSSYYSRTLVLLFIFPVACVLLCSVSLALVIFLNKSGWLDKWSKKYHSKLKELPLNQPEWNYVPYIILCGCFYVIPAVQVVSREAEVLRDEGDRDVCFYNELCLKPDEEVHSSNSIWSNVGYLWAGLTLILYLVLLRVLRLRYLVPSDLYVMFSIAVAIIFVGILSAIYHICPTRQIFQFDTAFMFIATGIVIVEIYRKYFHTTFPPWMPFSFFAVLLLLNYIGSLIDTEEDLEDKAVPRYIFKAILTVFAFIILNVYIWFVYTKEVSTALKSTEPHRKKKSLSRLCASRWERIWHSPWHPYRLIAGAIWYIIVLAIIWYQPNSDLSKTLLALMVGSSLYWVAYYILKKIIRGAKGCFSSKTDPRTRGAYDLTVAAGFRYKWLVYVLWIYLVVCTLAIWVAALVFFSVLSTSDKELRPEESRELNSNCLIDDFWDAHDIWHILSALALMVQALLILHMDIDERYTTKLMHITQKQEEDAAKKREADEEEDEEEMQRIEDRKNNSESSSDDEEDESV